ncbi:hypothetical protein INT47_005629 [Mucor saturninus]|uniref:Uncharacterized protein n=1 Tax=Mucor saturninus TaxID=64648 RepID=A0A8H7QLT6_9FUNG|nr:hypothetical protein INT47_005629 [Mucor saturninus]
MLGWLLRKTEMGTINIPNAVSKKVVLLDCCGRQFSLLLVGPTHQMSKVVVDCLETALRVVGDRTFTDPKQSNNLVDAVACSVVAQSS